MGMFDYIRCEMPLPETPEPPPGDVFQSKDTDDQYMTLYTITADGRLTWRPYTMEEVPRTERRFAYGDKGALVATVRGWICPFCDYTQDWAHDSMKAHKFERQKFGAA